MKVIADYEAIFTAEDYTMGARLPAKYAQKYQDEVAGYVTAANPLTEQIWDRMTPEERRPYQRPNMIWITNFGLRLLSAETATTKLSAIKAEWHRVAEQYATIARDNAGWTGRNFLTDPNGKKTNPGGGKYTRYTMPYDVDNMGDFDGTIEDDTKFTK